MKIQFRYRSMVLAALAISLLAIAGFPQTSSAGAATGSSNSRAENAAERRADNNGQAKKADDAQPSEGTPTAADNPEGATTHDSENGPGGQTCDGDPSGRSDTGDGANGAYDNYDNTCDNPDPNAAPNGAGGGNATGKPCAGCVGNADDKNPPGQYPNGPTDHNNGYECDEKGRSANEGNNGVGFGNPAHTGCTPEDDCVPTTSQNADCSPKCVPTANQNADCSNKCVPTANQNADCSNKCVPTANQNADCSNKCVPTASQDASCKEKTCPAGQVMANGSCSTPCVAGQDAACSQSTPSCVASDGSNRCGGGAVLGETLARATDVLGVSVEAPAGAVAPAALARTGGFELSALVQAGIVLAMVGFGLTVMGRRRRQFVDIASRLGD